MQIAENIKSTGSRIFCDIDLTREGHQSGALQIRHSDNRQSLGYYPTSIVSIKNGDGPIALLVAGVHGDEFEGPVALHRLAASLKPEAITGQIVILPAANTAAVESSARISSIDHKNLNRSFPGDPDGGPTDQIAHFIEKVLLPECDLAIDLHSGGKASVFAPTALPTRTADTTLFNANMELASRFGTPLIWLLSGFNDNRSLNSAAERAGVPMIAAELGGGGGCDASMVEIAVRGVTNCLRGIGIVEGDAASTTKSRVIEIASPEQNVYAPVKCFYDRLVSAGDNITGNQLIGKLFPFDDSGTVPVVAPCDGVVLAHSNRGLVERGDMLVMIATDVSDDKPY